MLLRLTPRIFYHYKQSMNSMVEGIYTQSTLAIRIRVENGNNDKNWIFSYQQFFLTTEYITVRDGNSEPLCDHQNSYFLKNSGKNN